MAPQIGLYQGLTEGEVFPPSDDIPTDPQVLADNLKASCYFMDASMVGICEIPATAWYLEDSEGKALEPYHRWALVIVVEHGREPEAGSLEASWISGSQERRGDMRALEIATVMAGYIRRLAYPARAQSQTTGDLAPEQLVAAAGLGWIDAGGEAINPFLGKRFRSAVVTTDMPLAVDRPLKPPGPLSAVAPRRLGYFLGLGGVRPGWRRLRGDHRPLHLSRFPMEKIAHRDETTTFIGDNVPRVPTRAGFFDRAKAGDLGQRPQAERRRFATKHPFSHAMTPLLGGAVPLQDGEVAAQVAPGHADPVANARAVKAVAYYLGVDLAGICKAEPYAWYSHGAKGEPIEVDHKYAMVVLIDQGYETMAGASGDDWISATQSMRAYLRGAEVCNTIAAHIRGLGYSARSHTNSLSQVLQIPLALLAGLGEMSRIGEMVLNPFVGPRFKSAVVTTNMPLEVDRPIDFGLQDFCEKCVKCARECPCFAIPYDPKTMFNGYEIWKPDVEKCAKYRLTNMKGSACGRCMKACPYNTEGLLSHRFCLWLAIRFPFLRRWLAQMDDRVGNGTRNPIKRWWFDLEMVERKSVKPKGTNERDLDLERTPDPAKQRLAHYPLSMAPPPGHDSPFPTDRAAALLLGEQAEKPPPRE
ncbi:MAG: reductive dehalogenase [bacterium]